MPSIADNVMLRLTGEVGSSWEAKERTYFMRQAAMAAGTLADAKHTWFTAGEVNPGSNATKERDWYISRATTLGLGLPSTLSLMDYKMAVLNNASGMPAVAQQSNDPPSSTIITLINPSSINHVTGIPQLRVRGTGFQASSVILVDGSPVQTEFVNTTGSRTASFNGPQNPGTRQIQVKNPGEQPSNSVTLTIT